MSGGALLAGRLIIIAGIANLLRKEATPLETELLERLIIDAATAAEMCNMNLSLKNRKKLADRLQMWQVKLIESEPTRLKLVILASFMSSDMYYYMEGNKSEGRRRYVKHVYEAVLDLITIYDPDGEFFDIEVPSVLDLVEYFFSLIKQ